MNKHEVTFKRSKIYSHYYSYDTSEKRIEYFEFLLNHYRKIYELSSNEEYQKFIIDNNLKESFWNNGYLRNKWKHSISYEDKIKNFKYYSPKYRSFIDEIMQIINFVESELKMHQRAIEIMNSDFLKVLEINLLTNKINTFKNDKIAYDWLTEYYTFLSDLSSFPYVFFYDELFEKNNLEESYPKQGIAKAPPINAYDPFVNHLKDTMMPFVHKRIKAYELKIKIAAAKKLYPNKFKCNDDKFPVLDFDYERILKYSESIFKLPEETFEYYMYIINYKVRLKGLNSVIPEKADNCVDLLKIEVQNIEKFINIRNGNRASKRKSTSQKVKKPGKSKSVIKFEGNAEVTAGTRLIQNNTSTIIVAGDSIPVNNSFTLLPPPSKTIKTDRNIIKNSDKLRWLGSKSQLNVLLSLLQKHDFIEDVSDKDNSNTKYFAIFVDKDYNGFCDFEAQKVVWRSELSELAYIIGSFTASRTKALIHNTDKWKKTSKVFLSKDSTKISPDSLRTMYNRKNITSNHQILNRIIEAVKNTKL